MRTFSGVIFMMLWFVSFGVHADFSQKLDMQFRVDDRSNRELRYQYRARYYPQYQFNDAWSAHGFAVTGDEFSSSHNTLDDGESDYLYVRRLYARHSGEYGKTEIGYIPTYKGRISSTGLSKDGWIAGVRHVRQLSSDNQLEVVFGQLDSLDPANALDAPSEIDYIEIEYSARMDKRNSYEFSLERMTGGNFLRTEYRYQATENTVLFAELVKRVDRDHTKILLGLDMPFDIQGYEIETFSYYAYVGENFGPRADLIEDFLGAGHGISTEFSGGIQNSQFDWFVRYDLVESRSRLLAGIKWSL